MKLEDLLDELRNNILHDRSAQTGGATSDYLWSDKTLVRYINEAQKRFARQALVIRDGSTPSICQITLQANVSEYPLDQSVITVLSAKISTAQADLVRTGHWALGSIQPPNTAFWDPSHFNAVQPGPPLAYATDEEFAEDDNGSRSVVTLRIFPVPSAAAAGTVINLRVCRLPLDELQLGDLAAVPEIPDDYHLPMLDWAAYLALRIVDHDGGDPERAAEFAAAFKQHVTDARAESLRKLFAPRPWGFGKGGFAWRN